MMQFLSLRNNRDDCNCFQRPDALNNARPSTSWIRPVRLLRIHLLLHWRKFTVQDLDFNGGYFLSAVSLSFVSTCAAVFPFSMPGPTRLAPAICHTVWTTTSGPVSPAQSRTDS